MLLPFAHIALLDFLHLQTTPLASLTGFVGHVVVGAPRAVHKSIVAQTASIVRILHTQKKIKTKKKIRNTHMYDHHHHHHHILLTSVVIFCFFGGGSGRGRGGANLSAVGGVHPSEGVIVAAAAASNCARAISTPPTTD